MLTESWLVERLHISDERYRALKSVGITTFGAVVKLTNAELAALPGFSVGAARDVLEQIAEFEQHEELTAQRAANAANRAASAAPAPPGGEPPEEQPATLPRTIEELQDYNKETISPEIAADILGCNPQTIRSQAQVDAGALGFPVIILGREVRIPRRGFIYFMEYGRTCVQKKS